ncbi:MAG: hypothetical protein ACREQH_15570 [Candidatus Binatus sp.]
MTPSIQLEEARFTEVAQPVAGHEIGDGVRLAQACCLEEILGAVFGSITLWYLVISIAGLA